jgi:SAM-dependent methyltransferase
MEDAMLSHNNAIIHLAEKSNKERIREHLKKHAPLVYSSLKWARLLFAGIFTLFRKVSSLLRMRTHRFLIWRQAGLPIAVELAALSKLHQARRLLATPNRPVNAEASSYVGTNAEEGIAQLAVLMWHGCRPDHKVLEVGCGALVAGYPVIQYLQSGNYCGIDPNRWLIEDSLKIPQVWQAVTNKRARFDYNADFQASMFDMKFDYVLSHSILSHAAHWQWRPFLQNIDRCLKAGSIVLASLHFTEGNEFGDQGYSGTELDYNEWVYPGISYFRKETIFNLARELGYKARTDLVAPMLITTVHPSSNHSWIVLEKK